MKKIILIQLLLIFFHCSYFSQTIQSGFSWVSTSATNSANSPDFPSTNCSNINFSISSSQTFKRVSNGAPYNNNGIYMPANSSNSATLISMTITFNQPISNLKIRFIDFDENNSGLPEPEESLTLINPIPTSVTTLGFANPFFLVGNIITPSDNNASNNNNDTAGWINWNGSLSTVTFSYNRPSSVNAGLIIDSIYFDCPISNNCNAIANAGPDLTICNNQTGFLNASNSVGSSFTWSTGSNNPSINVSTPGTYWVTVTDGNCIDVDTVVVNAQNFQPNVFNDDLIICPNSIFTLTANTSNFVSYLWNTGETTPTINSIYTGTYWVQVSDGNCFFKDTIIVSNKVLNFTPIQTFDTICENEVLLISAFDNLASSYLWNNGETTSSININEPGNYWVERIIDDCSIKEFVFIAEILNNTNESTIVKCKNESLVLSSSIANSNNYIWNNGSNSNLLTIFESGLYSVSTSNKCGTSIDKFTVIFNDCDCDVFIPNTFTPDEDEFNQTFKIKTSCNFIDFHLLIYNRWGEVVFESYDADEYWDGNYGVYKAQDGIYTYKVSYITDLKPDLLLLTGHVSLVK